MKKVKNVAFVVTLAGIFISICMVFSWQKEVKAGNLIQSDDEISKEVKHSHGDEMCHETVWVPCGGTWSAYFEPYHMCTCYSSSNWNSDELSTIRALNVSTNVFGMVDKIPAIIIKDIPFPIPFCVIWSPSHSKKAVPAVSMIVILT